ncbi:division/cell wall cluster transcriptional repressor MraZ [Lentimicrobium sp.]|jgi:MraZ protein|uniref:division/cell wall cluster transcriptional repressor MraZ n=1 Tax=Lentimicrobium sp. TaxID=2034841 RepID=UPI0025D54D9C|nr:division/cell wall cluster transcriptional repressor MraZ [Lentimicrobium sp.]MCO5257033.1 division/cell wall cluster transcriptional repressor MraZ [Lentimicrobium sp.]MCO5263243.1 division/cell wall cluster transcriptional repressor MraZ [Lentimicrobium sp.]HOP13291.1 division/cell wall cluster transcriptional repressor MraZ [Lentimicrobium sp.]HPF64909.1 division/cell wall cluster transcriptional repressor MraZ [Lentimicrobium sp.]HPJ61366.1 division/cell wall cluster transcriptional rep
MVEIIGVHDCKVDAKGRLMLPSALKAQLEAILADGFILKRSIFQPCLELYPRSEWNRAVKGVNKLNRFVKKNNDFIRVFMAGVREVEPDNTGRLLIPKDLAVFASISRDIVLASALNMIEIWDKDKYEASISESLSDFSQLAEEVMGQINETED